MRVPQIWHFSPRPFGQGKPMSRLAEHCGDGPRSRNPSVFAKMTEPWLTPTQQCCAVSLGKLTTQHVTAGTRAFVSYCGIVSHERTPASLAGGHCILRGYCVASLPHRITRLVRRTCPHYLDFRGSGLQGTSARVEDSVSIQSIGRPPTDFELLAWAFFGPGESRPLVTLSHREVSIMRTSTAEPIRLITLLDASFRRVVRTALLPPSHLAAVSQLLAHQEISSVLDL